MRGMTWVLLSFLRGPSAPAMKDVEAEIEDVEGESDS